MDFLAYKFGATHIQKWFCIFLAFIEMLSKDIVKWYHEVILCLLFIDNLLLMAMLKYHHYFNSLKIMGLIQYEDGTLPG